jgi:hypothetical protein
MTGIATTTPRELASGGRRRMTRAVARRWPAGVAIVAAASLAVWTPLPHRAQTYVSAWCVLLAAVIYLTWGTACGDLARATAAARADRRRARLRHRRYRRHRRHTPASGRFVLAAGWLGHAVWDAVHHRADCVVPAGTRRPASSAT